MTNVEFSNINQINDIEAFNYYIKNKISGFKSLSQKSRDNSRTVMQWDDSPYGGFSTIKPWIIINDNYLKLNVKMQLCGDTTLTYYQKMLKLCKTKVFISGKIKFIRGDLFSFYRYDEEDKYLIINNLNQKSYPLTNIKGTIIISNSSVNSLKLIDSFGSMVIKILNPNHNIIF